LSAWATASNALTIAEAGSNLAARVAADFDGASNAFLKAETYTGTITGGTITTGAVDSVTTNGGILEITYVRGGGTAGDNPATNAWALPVTIPNVGGTVTVSTAAGLWQAHAATGNIVLAVAARDTNYIESVRLELRAGAFTVTYLTSNVAYPSGFAHSTNSTTSILYDGQWMLDTWRAYEMGAP
jgi:hypothetical protein